jgi:hypothetical protein
LLFRKNTTIYYSLTVHHVRTLSSLQVSGAEDRKPHVFSSVSDTVFPLDKLDKLLPSFRNSVVSATTLSDSDTAGFLLFQIYTGPASSVFHFAG